MEISVNRFSVVLLLGWTVVTALGDSAAAASRGCTIDREEQTVLTAVLQSMTSQSGSVFVVESRTASSHFARTFSLSELLVQETTSDLSAQLKAAPSGKTVFMTSPLPIIPVKEQQEVEEEYKRKLSEPCNIPVMTNGSKQILFRSPAKVKEMFSGTDMSKNWMRFHEVFGEDAELVTFSRVAFDRARHYALVHVSSGLSSVAGGGDLYLLRCRNGKWSIERTFSTWAT